MSRNKEFSFIQFINFDSLLQKPAVYNEKTQELLKNALKNAKADSALQGVTRMDVEIKRAVKFLQISTDLRQYQKRADVSIINIHLQINRKLFYQNESQQKVEQKPVVKRNPSININTGQRIICRYDADGYFYSGTLQKNHDGRSIVLFDMDIEQEAIGHILLPANNSSTLTNLCQNDCVLVRQMRETEEYWAPGLVLCLPSPFALPPNLYMMQVHDPVPKQVGIEE